MKISHGTVVAIDFTLTDDDGEEIDSSEGDQPLVYLHGEGQIVEGLERALEGRAAGDEFSVDIPPELGYGEESGEEPIRVSRKQLPSEPEPEVGMDLHAVSPDGEEQTFWIVDVDEKDVLLSADHPLAGLTLHFKVAVREVRAATEEERAHGHAHGPDGHHDH
jgi:FKBP-type peptidyl-prolyl cis-trans isomerase SlyD